MRARHDDPADFIEVVLHRLGAGVRHDDRRSGAPLGANRAEQIGRFGSQIGQGSRPGAAPRPASGDFVLLAKPHLVLKPDLYRRAGRKLLGGLAQANGEVFLNASISAGSCPRWRGRAEIWRKPNRLISLPTVLS